MEEDTPTTNAPIDEPKPTTSESDTIVIESKAKPKRKPKSPVEKVECLKCGILVRKYDLKRHETMYCNAAPEQTKPLPVIEEPAPKAKAKPKTKPKAKPATEPDAPSYPKELPLKNDNDNENDLIMKLLQHMNTKPRDNREERYKRMMGQFYKI